MQQFDLEGKARVFWFRDMDIDFLEHAKQMVHMHVKINSRYSFWFSTIYAKCMRVGRHRLWQALQLVRLEGAWMVGGNFNVISSADERVGRKPVNIKNMEEFNNVVFQCSLSAVEYDGQSFT